MKRYDLSSQKEVAYMKLTAEELKKYLDYNPETGIFIWKKVPSNRVKINTEAGWIRADGYRLIKLFKITYPAHHLAWFYIYGKLPEDQIDHINGIPNDNRIVNLREVTNFENGKNQKLRKNNTSGVMGVHYIKPNRKWSAYIDIKYKRKGLGYYDDKWDAICARKSAEKKYGFHENHGRIME